MIFKGKENGKKLFLALGLGIALAGLAPTVVNAAPKDMVVASMDEDALSLEENNTFEALQANIVASGVDRGCSWQLDSNGKLTVRSTGSNSDLRNSEWKQYKEQIKEVDVDVAYCSHMSYMFSGFNNLEKAKVKIDKGRGSAEGMFAYQESYYSSKSSLKEVNLYQLNTSEVTNMNSMFYGCDQLVSLDLSGFDTSMVESMSQMFYGCEKLSTLNIGSFDTSKVVDFSRMFENCDSIKVLDIKGFDVYNARTFRSMFKDCQKLESVSMKEWDTSNVGDLSYMFQNCEALKTVDFTGWNTGRVMYMEGMFRNCQSLKTLNLSGLDVSHVKNMQSMFYDCKNLKSLNISGFNTSRVEYMNHMFYHCSALKEIKLNSFSAASLKDISGMFYGCSSLTHLDLSSFSMTKAFNDASNGEIYSVFSGCDELFVIKPPKNLKRSVYLLDGGTQNWYRDDTKAVIKELPQKLTKTITIHRQEMGNPLFDVRKADWQYEPSRYVYQAKIMNGTGSTEDKYVIFEPDKAMTRAEFVQTLYNYKKTPNAKYVKNRFTDVPNGKWYTKAIMWASTEGLVAGIGNKKFGVDNKVTRQDMVTILYKLAKKEGNKYITVDKNFNLKSYTDQSKVSTYAKTAMTWAAGNKIISGKPVGKKYKLDPNGNATRAECAAIIKNYVEFKKSK